MDFDVLTHDVIANRHVRLDDDTQRELLVRVTEGRQAQRDLDANEHNPDRSAELERIIADGRQARNRLILHNCRLVFPIAAKYHGQGIEYDDLFQQGMMGLTKAIDRFDPRYGTALSTIACWWIRQYISRYVGEHSRTVRIPVHRHEQIIRLKHTHMRLLRELGREPTGEELDAAQETAGDSTRYISSHELLKLGWDTLSLDWEILDDSNDTLGDRLFNDEDELDDKVLRGKTREAIAWAVSQLTNERERDVIERRFGLNGYPPHRLEDIGEAYGFTRERARQIEQKALHRLRHLRIRRQLRQFVR